MAINSYFLLLYKGVFLPALRDFYVKIIIAL